MFTGFLSSNPHGMIAAIKNNEGEGYLAGLDTTSGIR